MLYSQALINNGKTMVLTPSSGQVKASFIWLHGLGLGLNLNASWFNYKTDSDLKFHMPPDFRIVIPQGPFIINSTWNNNPKGEAWYASEGHPKPAGNDAVSVALVLEHVKAEIEFHKGESRKVFLGGYS